MKVIAHSIKTKRSLFPITYEVLKLSRTPETQWKWAVAKRNTRSGTMGAGT
jgi:hypothetical protein